MQWPSVIPLVAVLSTSVHVADAHERPFAPVTQRTLIKLAKAEPALTAPPPASPSSISSTSNVPPPEAPLGSRDFLANWRSYVGKDVTLGPCTLSPPGPSGMQCTFFNGSKEIGAVMLPSKSIEPASEFWVRENCDKRGWWSTTCSVVVSGTVAATEMGATLTTGRIRHDIAIAPATPSSVATPVIAAATVSAQPVPTRQRVDTQRRREILPFVRAASDCVARAIAHDENHGRALQWLEWDLLKGKGATGPLAECLFTIKSMIAAHDRIYGAGTGQAFYESAYLKDLSRAVTARLGSARKIR